MFTKEKNPVLSASGRVGGLKANKRLKRKLGSDAYRQYFSDLAKKRWSKSTTKPKTKKSVPSATARVK